MIIRSNRRRNSTSRTILLVFLTVLPFLFLLLPHRENSSTLIEAFLPVSYTVKPVNPTSLSCICVDCKWVTSCKAYHFVETKHEQPHMSEEPTFLPREGSPTINVNIRTEQRQPKAGDSENKPRMWKDQIQDDDDDDEVDEPKRDAKYYEETGTIETVKTNTTTTIEYDIVKCADFLLDKGCWVRNMPDEIKRVNPDFVPT